jgi:glycosyltransferase involved in cell wall biosynthesis
MSMAKDEQPLVSVVTPVYNGAEFIRECIESVLSQTYANWEYVIVDNCSTDGTLEIAREYEAGDPRIRVVAAHVFVGQLENGNRTIREIAPESEYTKVLHADDWMFPECLERMVELAERHPNVGVVSAYRLEETRVTLDGLPHTISVLPGRDICRSTLLNNPYPYLFGSPSSLLIRSNLIRARDPFYNPDYPFTKDHALTEDQDVCCAILRESDFGFVHQVLTFTRRPDGSPFSQFVRLGAYLPEHMNLLSRHGPAYLAKGEYQRKLAVEVGRYGFFLLGNLPRLVQLDFRTYHGAAARRLTAALQARDVLGGLRQQLQWMLKARRVRPGTGQEVVT